MLRGFVFREMAKVFPNVTFITYLGQDKRYRVQFLSFKEDFDWSVRRQDRLFKLWMNEYRIFLQKSNKNLWGPFYSNQYFKTIKVSKNDNCLTDFFNYVIFEVSGKWRHKCASVNGHRVLVQNDFDEIKSTSFLSNIFEKRFAYNWPQNKFELQIILLSQALVS